MELNGERSWLAERLDAVERRLVDHAAREAPSGLTDPEPDSGERWQAGQVWAHLAEFPAYWLGQARLIVEGRRAGRPEPIPFGRTKTDPARIAAIERDRAVAVQRLLGRLREGISATRDLLRTLPPESWAARGLHPVRGEMTVAQLVERFVVDHLYEHADQLESLSRRD